MIVCAKCNQQLRPKKNGVAFVELSGNKPYKLWDADLWECQTCGTLILYTGALQKPVAEHYQPNFEALMKSYAPEYYAKEWSRQ